MSVSIILDWKRRSLVEQVLFLASRGRDRRSTERVRMNEREQPPALRIQIADGNHTSEGLRFQIRFRILVRGIPQVWRCHQHASFYVA